MSEATEKGLASVKSLASYIPPKYRGVIYSALAAIVALELVWDFLEPGLESKFVGTLVILGFGMALGNTGSPQPAPVPEVEIEQPPSTP